MNRGYKQSEKGKTLCHEPQMHWQPLSMTRGCRQTHIPGISAWKEDVPFCIHKRRFVFVARVGLECKREYTHNYHTICSFMHSAGDYRMRLKATWKQFVACIPNTSSRATEKLSFFNTERGKYKVASLGCPCHTKDCHCTDGSHRVVWEQDTSTSTHFSSTDVQTAKFHNQIKSLRDLGCLEEFSNIPTYRKNLM